MEDLTYGTLCALCSDLFEDISKMRLGEWFPEDGRRPFHENNASLQDSLDSGCALCATLPYDRSSFDRDEIHAHRSGDHTDLWVDNWDYQDKEYRNRFIFRLVQIEEDDELFKNSQLASLESYTGHNRVLGVAAGWMSRCVHNHEQCARNQKPIYYPTRLLDIRGDVIRLIETTIHPLSGPYATLSHSWGQAKFKVLTLETLEEFRKGMHLRDFPKTFRDAILVAQHLDIPYFWIDCYCILQSEGLKGEDQLHEISEMGNVYSYTILNIGAACANSPMDGCLVSGKPRSLNFVKHTSKSHSRSQLYLLIDWEAQNEDFSQFRSAAENSVFDRAWCLQERFLCPRMLHLCRSGLFWECDTTRIASDCCATEYNSAIQAIPPFSVLRPSQKDQHHDFGWRSIVQAYSKMKLSRPSEDKFAACGGVAKRMAEFLNDDYVAGYFRRDILQQLWWRLPYSSKLEANITTTTSIWRAPSWSWASTDGEIILPAALSSNVCAEVISIDLKLVDPANPYGALESASITLKGDLLDVEIASIGEMKSLVRWGEALTEVYFDIMRPSRGNKVLFLIGRYEDDSGDVSRWVSGLVLEELDENLQAAKRFKRVGVFEYCELESVMRQAFREDIIEIV